MTPPRLLRVILIKPSKYAADGTVERFRRGFMPNSTLTYLASMTPGEIHGAACRVHAIDEYVQTDLRYLELLESARGERTLVALVGVQSHQFQRALDLAALARNRGSSAVIGGPHPMTCDTTCLQGHGISFALCEAELVWPQILADALEGALAPVYGAGHRWAERLDPPVLKPPPPRDLARYTVPMLGIYPARGCPYSCNFCSVIAIAGHRVRTQPVETTMASLRAAKKAGVRLILFTSDNFNKNPQVHELLDAMAAADLKLPFFAQCDAQIYREPELFGRLAGAGCFQMFVGAESFNSVTLAGAHKFHNVPDRYAEIVRLCREHGITSHFSNILGFPEDTGASILENLATLRALGPDVASFYILTPVPGTEQYADFRRRGLVDEENLDRFDGSTLAWKHPRLDAEELTGLLRRCYRDFFSAGDVSRKIAGVALRARDFRRTAAITAVAGYALHARIKTLQCEHPMAGGTRRVRRDRESDYAKLRRQVYGLSRAPLPDNLSVSPADEELNRTARLAPGR
ncbi:MAG TPA: radical SAM protein [Thermoanaerobaculia bacterium]|nr:radical SAM protein [Thermoanaerobaculia bacterium]